MPPKKITQKDTKRSEISPKKDKTEKAPKKDKTEPKKEKKEKKGKKKQPKKIKNPTKQIPSILPKPRPIQTLQRPLQNSAYAYTTAPNRPYVPPVSFIASPYNNGVVPSAHAINSTIREQTLENILKSIREQPQSVAPMSIDPPGSDFLISNMRQNRVDADVQTDSPDYPSPVFPSLPPIRTREYLSPTTTMDWSPNPNPIQPNDTTIYYPGPIPYFED